MSVFFRPVTDQTLVLGYNDLDIDSIISIETEAAGDWGEFRTNIE
jgi:hypothetical protein